MDMDRIHFLHGSRKRPALALGTYNRGDLRNIDEKKKVIGYNSMYVNVLIMHDLAARETLVCAEGERAWPSPYPA